MAEVLHLDPSNLAEDGWWPFALFESGGRCAANVEVALLPAVVDGTTMASAGIRSVAVASDWRGCGLFRALMQEALDWCDARSVKLAFLYTAEPALYGRFGFRPLAQHAFVGSAPRPARARAAMRLDVSDTRDRAMIERLVETRMPLSRQATLVVPPSVVLANLAKDTPEVAAREDCLIVYQDLGETLVLIDIATAGRLELAALLGALGCDPRYVRTMFSPDRFDWQGEPTEEHNGLMVRGTIPSALTRPFMFPPTAEF